MARSALAPFGTSVFTTYSQLARAHGAVNLGQGFPDFDGPCWIHDAAREAMREGKNQYSASPGSPRLRRAVAAAAERHLGIPYDAEDEVTVTTGATEGIAAAIFGLVDPGEEVLTFEPFYDSYPACCAMTGATLRAVPLRAPEFTFDRDELDAAFSDRTRLFVLNTPHNPTGRVFRRDELEFLLDCCRRHDCLLLSDEVYEHLTFGEHRHLSPAALDRERVVRLSSAAKTFSLTGWKVGWACAAAEPTAALRRAHQFLVFCAAAPLQEAVARALEEGDPYYPGFRAAYAERRDALLRALESAGYRAFPPEGSYFVMADVGAESGEDFVRALIRDKGVAAIPPASFYEHPEHARGLVRFAFCKTLETIEAAAERLRG